MRIISGKYRGSLIHPGKNFTARPTTDIAKEGIFNVINNRFDIDSINVLDLFSGTGSISFEFASRECPEIDAVELKKQHADFIRKIIQKYKFDNIKLYQADVFKFIQKNPKNYDIIFADPPFDMEKAPELPSLILDSDLLKEGGWFVFEHSKKMNLSPSHTPIQVRKYGNVHFSIFEK